MPAAPKRASTVSPFLVALVAWILPGTGYLLIKQRARGLTVGITIISLFFAGLLIGGVRCLEVPGYNAHGVKTYSYSMGSTPKPASAPTGERAAVRRSQTGQKPTGNTDDITSDDSGWTLDQASVRRGSLQALVDCPDHDGTDRRAVRHVVGLALAQPIDPDKSYRRAPGRVRPHSRVNELGVLFTAVAGMLNLLAMIDSAHRASHAEVE